jgi:DNA repair protein RecO (recombination protein O)
VALLAHQGKTGAANTAGAAALQGQTAWVLRAFELLLLRHLGLLPALNHSASGHALQGADGSLLHLQADRGLCSAHSDAECAIALPAACWLALEDGLQNAAPFAALLPLFLTWPAAQRNALRNNLRHLLHQHLGTPLKTRQLMVALQGL